MSSIGSQSDMYGVNGREHGLDDDGEDESGVRGRSG